MTVAKIITVQWDFDNGKRFSSTPGYSFIRGVKKEPELQAQYEFPRAGKVRVACKVQDDMGGEGLWDRRNRGGLTLDRGDDLERYSTKMGGTGPIRH